MQHDYDINSSDSISGLQFRADVNAVLSAIKSGNSGATAPTSNVVAGMTWYDTSITPAKLKIRNTANTAWVEVPIESTIGTPIASGAITTVGTFGGGEILHITGTTTITSLGVSTTGTRRTLIFDGALTITHNATSLICLGAENIVTVSGTIIEVICEDGVLGYWRVANISHASLSMAELGYLSGVTSDIQTQLNGKASINSIGIFQDFRLTLTTAMPVTTSNVTAATSIYLTPYVGNKLSIYDGTNWAMFSSAELSIAVPATTNTMYDIFVYSNAGTPTLELTAWTNDTTRATALVKQDGVYVKSGATTRRYLGSFRTTGVSGQTEDSLTKRYLWNYYNRVTRPMYVTDATVSWVYTTATWRQANGSTANQIDFVIGVSEDVVTAFATHCLGNTGTTGAMLTGIGLDVTNAPSNLISTNGSTAGTLMLGSPTAQYESLIPAGRHFLAWLEWSTAIGTTTWYTNVTKVGLQGEIIG